MTILTRLSKIKLQLKKELSLTDRQFNRAFGKAFSGFERELELRKIYRDGILFSYKVIKKYYNKSYRR